MRARLTYLALSPRTPRRIARWTVNAGGLAGAAMLLAGLATGDVSHAVFSAMVAL